MIKDSRKHDVQARSTCSNRVRSDDIGLFPIVVSRDFGIQSCAVTLDGR